MARERKNAPPQAEQRRRQRGSSVTDRIRHRVHAEPDVELSQDELRALADEGIDPEDLRRAAAAAAREQEASVHDRDTPRDEVEGLVLEQENDYQG